MDYIQEMSKATMRQCSVSFQDSDIDGSEFPGCNGSVDDLLIKLLSFC